MKYGSTEWFNLKCALEKLEDARYLLDKHNEDLGDELTDLINKIDDFLELCE